MIGLSLSFCVKDIMAGKVLESDVTKIITGTAARTEAEWDKLCKGYVEIYWRGFDAQAAIALIQRFRAQGKIEQPRLDNPDYEQSISGGHWVSEE